nr:hypothetical protein BMS3Bbin01_02240 [bacterium BMS3Bbin01]
MQARWGQGSVVVFARRLEKAEGDGVGLNGFNPGRSCSCGAQNRRSKESAYIDEGAAMAEVSTKDGEGFWFPTFLERIPEAIKGDPKLLSIYVNNTRPPWRIHPNGEN